MKTKSKIPALRFKGFADAWEERRLSEFVSFFNGLTYKPSDVREEGTLVLRSSNVKDGEIIDVTEQNGRIYHLEQHISKLGQEKTRVLTEVDLFRN